MPKHLQDIKIKSVKAGVHHSLILMRDGTVLQLGGKFDPNIPRANQRSLFAKINISEHIRKIECHDYSAAIS